MTATSKKHLFCKKRLFDRMLGYLIHTVLEGCVIGLEVEPKISFMLGKYSSTELKPPSPTTFVTEDILLFF